MNSKRWRLTALKRVSIRLFTTLFLLQLHELCDLIPQTKYHEINPLTTFIICICSIWLQTKITQIHLKSSAFSSGSAVSNSIGISQDYYGHIRSLASLLRVTNSQLIQMKQLVIKIKDLELANPSLSRLAGDESNGATQTLKAALANVKAAADVHGYSSADPKTPKPHLN